MIGAWRLKIWKTFMQADMFAFWKGTLKKSEWNYFPFKPSAYFALKCSKSIKLKAKWDVTLLKMRIVVFNGGVGGLILIRIITDVMAFFLLQLWSFQNLFFEVIICVGEKNLIGTHNKSKMWNTYEHCLECMIWKC